MRQRLSVVLALLFVLSACGSSDDKHSGPGGDTPGDDTPADTTAPVTQFTATPDELNALVDVTFAFEADEPARFECALDAAAFAACSSPHVIAGIAEGSHEFRVRAIDEAGNVEEPAVSHAFTVDRTAPVTTIEEAPTGASNAANARVVFSANEEARFECALDGPTFAACSSPFVIEEIAQGSHAFQVRAIDPAGNVEDPAHAVVIVVDRTAPVTTIEAAPAELSNATSARFVFSADEEAAFECALDGGGFAPCSSPLVIDEVAEGQHEFQVRANDPAGNVEEIAQAVLFAVDRTSPVTTLTEGPAQNSNATSARFVFVASEDARFECAMDGAAFAACSSPWVVSALAEGAHALTIRAIDPAGNVETNPIAHGFSIDRTAPVTTLDAPDGATGSSATFVFTANEAGSFECALDSGAFAPCTSPHTVSSLVAGEHEFSVRAIDGAGNVESVPATHVWIVEVGAERIRIVAANLTSGNLQSYDPGHGARILKGIAPDVVLIQEFNYGDNSASAIRNFVTNTFGANFNYYRESGSGLQIPNGVISRYPMLSSGRWVDSNVGNRGFAWARLDIPGSSELFVVSVHLLTSSASNRNSEAGQLRNFIQANVPAGDYVVIGGDFNTDTRTEAAFTTFSSVVSTTGPWPADGNGNQGTNASRSKPYDNVLVSADLRAFQVPVVIGSSTFPNGLVVDTRVYQPISEIAPAQTSDSAASSMQHMAVVRDFVLP